MQFPSTCMCMLGIALSVACNLSRIARDWDGTVPRATANAAKTISRDSTRRK